MNKLFKGQSSNVQASIGNVAIHHFEETQTDKAVSR